MIRDFLSGINYYIRGFRLLAKPELRRFVLIPLVINTLAFSAAIFIAIYQFDVLLDWLLPQGSEWWAEFARTVLWLFFSMLALLILFFTFTIAANFLGAPFNGLLSEKVEEYLSGSKFSNSGGLRDFISTILPSIKSELKKILYFLLTAILLFLVLLIPGVQIVSPVLWALFTSWMLALEYAAYPMENHRIFFSQVRINAKRQKFLMLGFGAAVMITSAIPVVNFIVMPAAVVGATLMWADRLKTD